MNKSSINDVDATSSAATKQPLIKPIGVAKPKMQSVECTKVPVVHLEPCIFTNVPVNISELPQKLLSSCRRKGEPIPIVLQHPNSAKKPTHSFSSAENSQVENVDSKSICSGPKKNSSASEKNMNETRTSTVSNNPTASDGTPPEKSSGEDFSFRKIKYTEKALNSGTWKTPSRIFRDSAENSPEEPVCSKSARLNTKAFSSGICIPPDGGTDSTAETSTPHIESKSLGLSEQQATVGAHTQGRRKKLCLSAEPSQSVLRSSLASSKHLECDKTFNDASPDLDDVEGASFVPYASQENSKENNNGTVTACKLNRCKNSTAMKGVGVIVGNTRNQGVGVGSFGYRLHSPVQYPDGQIIQLVPLPNPGSNLHQEVTLAVRNPGSGSENHLPTPIKSCSVASSPKNVTPCPKVTIPKRGRRRSTPDVKPACVALQTSTPQQISAVVSEVPVQTTSQAKFEAVNGVGQTINAGSEKTANQNSKSEEKLIEPGREEIHVADSELIETTVSQSVPDEDHVNADPLPEVKQATVAFPSTPLVREVDDELEDDSMDHQNALEHLTPAELVDHSHTSEKQIVEDENENFVLDNSTRTAKGSAVDKDSSRSNHEVVDKEPEEMPSMEEKNRLQDEQMEVEMEDKTCCFEASTFNVPLKRGEDMQKNPDNEELNFHQKLLQNENFLDTDKDTDSQSHLVDADSQGDAEKIDVVRMFDSNSTEEPMDIEPVEKPSEKINIALLTTYASHLRSKSNILKCLPNIYSTNPSSVASSENYGGPFKIIVEEEPPDDYEYNHVANPVILDCDGLKCKEKEFFDSEGWDGGTNCDLQSKTMNKSSINEVDATSSAVTKQPLISPIGVIKAKMLSVECTKVLAVYLEPYTFTNGTIKISELPQQLLSSGRRKGRPIPTVLQSPNSAKETIHSSSSAENSQVENVDAKSVCSGLKESGSASEKNVNKTSTSTVPNNPTASPGTSPEKSSGEGFKFRKIKYTEKAFNSGIWRTPQDALQSHVVEHVAEEPSNPIHPTANPQESEEEKIEEKKEETIEQLEEQLLEDLSHVDPIVITHPLREKEEVSFVSRTGKTNDFTKLKGWKQKLQGLLFPRLKGGKRQHSGSISKQNQTSAKPEYSLKNTSDVSSDKSDEYLENEEKIAQQSAALCMNKASNVVYQMPPKSSSYVHTLDSVLKSQSPQDDCRGSRTSTRTSVSPQPISVGSVSKNTKQIEMTLGPVADSKEQKSANNTKESSTPAKSAAKTSLPPSFAPMSPPRLSKKQIELMILENRALWVEKPRTCITEERADASLVPLLAAQAKSKGNNSGTVTVCKSNRSRNSTTIEAMESEKLDGFETNSMPPNAAQTTKRKQTEKTDSPLHCDSPQEERTSFQSETPQLSVETKNTSKLIEIISDCNWDSERSNIFGFLARYRYIEQETFGENKRPLEKIRIGNFVIEIVSNYGKNRDPSPGPVLISSFVVKISQSSEKEGNGKCNMSVPITTQSPGIQLTETPPNAPKETLPTPTKCTVQEKEFTGNGNGGTKLTLGHIGALHPVNWVTANHKNKIKVVEQFKMSSSSTVASSAAAHLPSKHLTTCSTSSGNDVLCDTNDATPVNQSKEDYTSNKYTHPVINKVGGLWKTKSSFSTLEPVLSRQQLDTPLSTVSTNVSAGISPLTTVGAMSATSGSDSVMPGALQKSISMVAESTGAVYTAGSRLLKILEITDAVGAQFSGISAAKRLREESVTASIVETTTKSTSSTHFTVISASASGVSTMPTLTKELSPSASTKTATAITNTVDTRTIIMSVASMVNKTPGVSKHPETSNSTPPDLSNATETDRSQHLLIPVQSTTTARPAQNLQHTTGQKIILQPLRFPDGKLFQHPNGQIIQLLPLPNPGPVSRPNLHQMVTLAEPNPGSVSGNCLPTPIKSCSMASSPSNVILCPKQMIPKRGRPRSTPVVFPTPIKSCSMASSPSNVILCPKGIIPQRGRPRSTRVINPTCVALKQTFTPQPISAVASEVPVKTTSQPPIVAVNGVGQTISAWHLVPLQPVGFALLQLPQGMSNPIVTAGQSLKLVNQSSGSQSFEKAGSEKTANQNNKSEEKLIEPGLEEIIVAVSELIETTVSQGVPDEDHVNADPSPEVKQATDAFPSTPSVIEVDDEFEDDSMDHQNALEHHTPAELVDHSYTCVKHIVEEENDNSVLDNSTRTGKGSAVDKDSYRSNHEVDKDMLKNSENEDLDFHQRLLRYENFMDSDKDTDSQSDLEDGDSQSDPEEMDERMFDSTSSEEGMDIENMEEISDKINIDHLIAYASRLTSKSKCHFNNPYLANKLDEVVEGDIKSKPKHIANLSKEAQAQLDALMEWRSTRTENERQRRSELRDLFEKLKKTLAIRGEEKASKYFILKQAFAEIQNLQNDSDCLSAGESVQTRRRDSLLQKISLLTGQTEEVILKNLENNCALDVEKRTSMQEGDDASEQHSVSGNTASISSMDSLPKVAMDLQIQKPPNVTMLCGGQDLMSEASRAKPLILTRKHSSTPQSSTSSIPLTTGSLLMTPQDHVPTLKGPLISDQTPFFTAEGLLNENQSKGDGVTGASIADDEVSSFMMPRIVNVTSLATGESPLLNPEEANDSCALSRDFSMKGRKYTSQEQLSPMTSKKPSLSIIKSNSQSSEQFTAPDESEAM
ncbi:MAX gene-associated protein-like isoform X1 [Leucoraja erinacea]|uniref:MAX gene-associated protein-like isoform X1 n=1 Tax=Leucoraja erinaceus TaxID=7782 RepID=UPI002458D7A0|nr:MAX gene-associated protein-like isoform X1 [Leucoraja erinacea]XP_055496971.1 MAX gene-associated protein-like isoform X1 [Leucoraja erinacea]XP_055496972.1 MAX gene-associated protein-like isoform X1 [Leucoraja erinacea]